MRNCSQKERFEFIHLMMKHAAITPTITEGDIQRVAVRLLRYGATYGRLQEQDCNVGLTDKERAKEARFIFKMVELAETIGCKVHCSGDPRGNTVKIVMPDGYTNDWGREGLCVPTS